MFKFESNEKRLTRWYFGGISATVGTAFTYPIDVIRIGLQTEQILEKVTVFRYIDFIRRTQGAGSFYFGIGASLRQQMLYSLTRFGIYESVKNLINFPDLPFLIDVALSTTAGAIAGFVRTPHDVVMIRMLTDIKLPPPRRRNYKSVFEAMKLIYMVDGYRALFVGGSLSVWKSILLTVGQITTYEKFKYHFIHDFKLEDEFTTHISSSLIAGIVATVLSQPAEVLRSRYMATTEEFQSIYEVIKKQATIGMSGFFRGTLLNYVKVGPQTVITFVLMEQMRLYFGYLPDEDESVVIREPIITFQRIPFTTPAEDKDAATDAPEETRPAESPESSTTEEQTIEDSPESTNPLYALFEGSSKEVEEPPEEEKCSSWWPLSKCK